MKSTQTVLNVEGMTCSHCSEAIGKALRPVDGVYGVGVDLKAGTVMVVYDADKADIEEIKEKINELGYSVKS